ncbi:Lysophospholipase 2 [Sparassis crispa]|uniref:Lysophospholipase n=1 Tax=Sparassis crispa TaxID=139825 RepID=A0A401GHN6_9APHY|nr:Lysophospholipase 2 [Sparassis crispa]GBE81631.1 Lysophospholipase 2 [Sparassis crispa]
MLLLIVSTVLWAAPYLVAGQTAAAEAYAPSFSLCPPGTSLIREAGTTAQNLSFGESAYISNRTSKVLPEAWRTYLASVQISTHDEVILPGYVSAILEGANGSEYYPKLGIATSGGGYRAAIFGAGVLNTLDARNVTSIRAGTGGLLQAASYLSGLSGGGWLVSSLVQANFPTLPKLIFGAPNASAQTFGGWNVQLDLLTPSTNTSVEDYLVELIEEASGKALEGFPVTITDVWARALSRHFVNGTSVQNFANSTLPHGAGITLSSLANLPSFQSYVQPFPIITADSIAQRENTSNIVPGNTVPLTDPIYEFNVYEMGSFDPVLGAFTPTKFLGSSNGSLCTTGFDQLPFVQGVSSNLFNAANTSTSSLQNSSIYPIIQLLEKIIPEQGLELALAQLPNPFHGLAPQTYTDTNTTLLMLGDGGEDGEVIPFQPLLVKARGVEVIFAIDAASDTEDNFSDGSSIIATQDRVALFPNAYSFPPVPPLQSTFLSHNLTKQPTFFGCNASSSAEPFVIYLANGGAPLGQAALTNTSTEQLSYSAAQIDGMLQQVFDVATQGIPTEHGGVAEKDPEWPACLACGIVDRARARAGVERSGVCVSCLERYCWS